MGTYPLDGRRSSVSGIPGMGSRIALFALAVCLLAGLGHQACGKAPSFKNVIVFIGDGMSVASETAASRYLYGKDAGLAWHSLAGRTYVATWDVTAYNHNARRAGQPPYDRAAFAPRLGYDVLTEGRVPPPCDDFGAARPAGVRRPATDSASAATALATGFKTESGRIAWLAGGAPDGRLTTIAEECRTQKGMAIGVVTTVPFDHATPAAFVSHNLSRNNYYTGYKGYRGVGIGDEIILEVKPDVVIGAGHPLLDNPKFDNRDGYISESLLGVLRSSPEYVLAERQAGVDGGRSLAAAAERAAAGGKKLFGLFGGSGGNFEPRVPDNRPGSPGFVRASAEDPTLKQATLAALRVLSQNPHGFFLMVEQGDIDWANHDNDFRGMIGCVDDLEEAVQAARAFVDRPGDAIDWTNTVLVVTADHATGGLCLNPARPLRAGSLPRQIVRSDESGPVSGGHVNGSSKSKPSAQAPIPNSPYIYPDGEVSYNTLGHSNELVSLRVNGSAASYFLKYKGSWYPGPIIDNTQVNAALRDALGLPALTWNGRRPAPKPREAGAAADVRD